MKLKLTILVCTLLLVVLSLGSVSALDDNLSQDNLTTGSIQEDTLSETSVKEVDLKSEEVPEYMLSESSLDEVCLENEEFQDNMSVELESKEAEIQQTTISKYDDEAISSDDIDETLSYNDGNIIVEVFPGPYYLGYSDPICRIVDYSGVDGYITIMIDGSSKYDEFGSSSGYSTSWEYTNPDWINSYGYGNHDITVYYQKKKVYSDTKTVEFTYFFDCYALEDGTFTTTVEYGDNINLNLQLPEDVTGKATVKIGESIYEVSLTKGKGEISIPTLGLNIGNNTIYAEYAGDSKYTYRNITETIFIYDQSNKPADKITSKDFNVDINDVVNILDEDYVFSFTCPINAQGKIATWINDVYNPDQYHDYYVDGVYLNGEVTKINLNVLGIKSTGKYDLVIRFIPYSGRNITLASGSVMITKSNGANLTADDFNVIIKEFAQLDDDYAFSFNCPKDAQGKIAVIVNNSYAEDPFHDYYIDGDVMEGETTVMFLKEIGIDSPGQYDILVKYVPYFGENLTLNSATLTVKPASININCYNQIDFNSKSEMVLSVNKFPDVGNLTVYVDGQLKYFKMIEDVSRLINILINDLAIDKNGNYNLSVKFKTNNEEYDLGMFPISIDMDLNEIVDEAIEIFSYSDILLKDDDIAGIFDEECINGTVSVYIDDKQYYSHEFKVSDNLKYLFLNVEDLGIFNNISIGNHSIKIIYMKNNNVEHFAFKNVYFEATCNIDVPQLLSAGENEKIIITTLKGSSGKVIVYYGVKSGNEWIRGEEIFNALDIVDGSCEIPLDSLKSGNYKLYLNISTNRYQNEYSINVNVNDNSDDIAVDVGPNMILSSEKVLINFKGPKSNVKVNIYLDGEKYGSFDLSNGVISQNIENLSIGSHNIKITYASGDKFYSNTFTITVKKKLDTKISSAKLTTTYNAGAKLVATLTDCRGNALANKKVTVKVGSISKTLTTNAKGKISLKITALKPKTYTATLNFKGDGYYISSTAKVKVVVKKAKPKIVAKKKTFKRFKKVKKYTITFKNNKNKPIKKAKLTLTIKGKKFKAKTNSKGKATFKISKFYKKGKFNVKVKFNGDKCYKKITKKVKISCK